LSRAASPAVFPRRPGPNPDSTGPASRPTAAQRKRSGPDRGTNRFGSAVASMARPGSEVAARWPGAGSLPGPGSPVPVACRWTGSGSGRGRRRGHDLWPGGARGELRVLGRIARARVTSITGSVAPRAPALGVPSPVTVQCGALACRGATTASGASPSSLAASSSMCPISSPANAAKRGDLSRATSLPGTCSGPGVAPAGGPRGRRGALGPGVLKRRLFSNRLFLRVDRNGPPRPLGPPGRQISSSMRAIVEFARGHPFIPSTGGPPIDADPFAQQSIASRVLNPDTV
jgi:hypothetical protein